MPFVQATEAGRWSVNFEGRDVEKDEFVSFDRHQDAEFIVSLGKARFVTEAEMAVAMNRQNKAAFPELETGTPVVKKKPAAKKAAAKADAEPPKPDDAE